MYGNNSDPLPDNEDEDEEEPDVMENM